MRCPYCGHEDSQVKDSRPTEDGAAIRRRRQCEDCGARFTTFERIQLREVAVLKAGGGREPFDREKLMRSVQIACRKRPIDGARIERSEEHTSELQSLMRISYAVFCLKKKRKRSKSIISIFNPYTLYVTERRTLHSAVHTVPHHHSR